uniref:Uncharacterized protein n=1 Tax=Candidatus Kentrum sp. FM TaxID=2126340 RepID=A0A450VN80_9GAMM|nr:MAG: hypothetical protein BECKFM1743A_GA0114220_100125 [Candidatus Kentron sp. FM]VFJ44248.1 MAG: hypothetical protein BECKFM1743C_GA0114222_100098 [Candidatus Kentron sp. FM]VFK06157.1 MAG: hypothetical protein BECKFM1743B_GA0114221_1001112 [Candidatus Kentron sp. FM]
MAELKGQPESHGVFEWTRVGEGGIVMGNEAGLFALIGPGGVMGTLFISRSALQMDRVLRALY